MFRKQFFFLQIVEVLVECTKYYWDVMLIPAINNSVFISEINMLSTILKN